MSAATTTDLRDIAERITGAVTRLQRLDQERARLTQALARLAGELARACPPEGDLERYTTLARQLAAVNQAPYLVVRPHPKAVSGDITGWYVVGAEEASDEDRANAAGRVEEP